MYNNTLQCLLMWWLRTINNNLCHINVISLQVKSYDDFLFKTLVGSPILAHFLTSLIPSFLIRKVGGPCNMTPPNTSILNFFSQCIFKAWHQVFSMGKRKEGIPQIPYRKRKNSASVNSPWRCFTRDAIKKDTFSTCNDQGVIPQTVTAKWERLLFPLPLSLMSLSTLP